MCRTMNELEKVIADYRSLKAMKEQLEEELKAVEREIIGYMDTLNALDTGGDLAQAAEEIKLRSRQYAKRQLTWFRRDPAIKWMLLEKEYNFSSLVQASTDYLREKGLP